MHLAPLETMHEKSNQIFWKKKINKMNKQKCRLLKFLHSMLSVKITLLIEVIMTWHNFIFGLNNILFV